MRRIALALVAVAFVFAVAACGGDEEASPEPETTEGTITTEPEDTETEEETTDTGDAGGQGDPAAGKEVFLGAGGCGSCHTFADAGTSGTIGPNLDDSQPDFELAVDRVTNGQGAMPAFGDQLTEQQIADVSAYVSAGG
jgi:mono/diheme cytochrome c family protein